jgi:hypothetical protein
MGMPTMEISSNSFIVYIQVTLGMLQLDKLSMYMQFFGQSREYI